jgi:hypothetical protein
MVLQQRRRRFVELFVLSLSRIPFLKVRFALKVCPEATGKLAGALASCDVLWGAFN